MKKVLFSAGILTGLGLAVAYTGHGQTQKTTGKEQGQQPDSLRHDSLSKKQMALEMKAMEEIMRQADIEMAKADELMKQADIEMQKAELEMAKADIEMQKADIEMAKADEEMRKADIEMQKADAEMAKAEIEMREAEKEMEKANIEIEQFNKIHTALVEELKKEMGEEIVNYELSATELIVNGKKQPEKLQQRLSKKYLGDKKSVVYKHDVKTGQTTIHTE